MKKNYVVLTRKENDLHELNAKFPNIDWIEFPLIEFEYQKIRPEILDQINDDFDWIIFTSQNGVKSFFEQSDLSKDKKIACVGPKTANIVENHGYKVEFLPSVSTSFCLAQEIPISSSENACYIGGNLSNATSINVLKSKAHKFLQIEVYKTIQKLHNIDEWEGLFENKIDVISFCSPSAVDSYIDQISSIKLNIPGEIHYSALGTTTFLTIQNYTHSAPIIGDKHTFDSMIVKIVQTLQHDS